MEEVYTTIVSAIEAKVKEADKKGYLDPENFIEIFISPIEPKIQIVIRDPEDDMMDRRGAVIDILEANYKKGE